MDSSWDLEILDRPGLNRSKDENESLQSELCELGSLCLNPLPPYQVFERQSGHALDDKIIVVARLDGAIVGFVSAILLPVDGLDKPVVHTGLTIIHPRLRKSGIMQAMFANLFFYLMANYPEGIWCTTLAEVISSLVQMSLYTTNAFPSPQWTKENADGKPSPTHFLIADAINNKYRDKLLISSDAVFEEETFVFRASNDSASGKVFWKDVDDPIYWHRNVEQSCFYRKLFRRNMGDEVLQVSYLELGHLENVKKSQRFRGRFDDLSAKVKHTPD